MFSPYLESFTPAFCARILDGYVNPNVAHAHRLKSLLSCHSARSAAVLASDRISRTVKYASSCPSLRAAISEALWRIFSGCRSTTLGYSLQQIRCAICQDVT